MAVLLGQRMQLRSPPRWPFFEWRRKADACVDISLQVKDYQVVEINLESLQVKDSQVVDINLEASVPHSPSVVLTCETPKF